MRGTLDAAEAADRLAQHFAGAIQRHLEASTLVDEFAYARIVTRNRAQLDALPRWVRYYTSDDGTPHSTATPRWRSSTNSSEGKGDRATFVCATAHLARLDSGVTTHALRT